VLSIGKLTVEQSRYYERQVAQGRDDYYSGRGESPGRWTGAGADGLRLGGRVEDDGLMALMDGRDPGTGERLRRVSGRSKVAAFDLTFSAPKSVSLLFAIGEPVLAGALVDAHESAVDAAVGYLEREACRVRRGRAGVRREVGEGFVAAAYRHRMSRAEDPQLHTHVVAANMARGADGRWTALDATPIYLHAKAAGYLYQAHLRAAVRGRLPWVRWGRCATGWPRSSSYHRLCYASSLRGVGKLRSASASWWPRASRSAMADVRRSLTTRADASATGSTPRRGVMSCAPGRPSTASVCASSPPSCSDRRGRPRSPIRGE
jgi:TrwC relaxase